MYYSCSKCGKIHIVGYKCKTKRTYNKTDIDKLRSKYSWTMKAIQIKEDALGLCEVCKQEGIYNYNNLEVHHITKLKDNPEGLLKDDNLICLCSVHHTQADSGELSEEYLRKIARERVEKANQRSIVNY